MRDTVVAEIPNLYSDIMSTTFQGWQMAQTPSQQTQPTVLLVRGSVPYQIKKYHHAICWGSDAMLQQGFPTSASLDLDGGGGLFHFCCVAQTGRRRPRRRIAIRGERPRDGDGGVLPVRDQLVIPRPQGPGEPPSTQTSPP